MFLVTSTVLLELGLKLGLPRQEEGCIALEKSAGAGGGGEDRFTC